MSGTRATGARVGDGGLLAFDVGLASIRRGAEMPRLPDEGFAPAANTEAVVALEQLFDAPTADDAMLAATLPDLSSPTVMDPATYGAALEQARDLLLARAAATTGAAREAFAAALDVLDGALADRGVLETSRMALFPGLSMAPADPRARDALAILANLYLRYGRAEDAIALFGAVAQLDEDPGWARRARCVALLRAGRHAEAAAEAGRMLDEPLDDTERVPLLHAMAKACWALGRVEEARAAHREACAATRIGYTRRRAGAR